MVSFLDALGNAAGGVAQGIQVGQNLAYQKKQQDLAEKQQNLQSISAFANVMEIDDPAVREYALSAVLPMMGIDPKSEQATNLTKLIKGSTDETRLFVTNFLRKQGVIDEGANAPDFYLKQFLHDPVGTMNSISSEARAGRTETREEEAQTFTQGLQTEQLGIQKADLGLRKREVAATEASGSRAAAAEERKAAAEERAQRVAAIDALTKVSAIKDVGVRRIAASTLNDTFEMNMTPDDIEQFAKNPQQSLEDLKTTAQTEEAKANTAKTQAETAALPAAQTDKGITALTNAAKLSDPAVRKTIAQTINETYKLNLTPQQIDDFSKNPDLDTIKKQLEITKTQGEIAKTNIETANLPSKQAVEAEKTAAETEAAKARTAQAQAQTRITDAGLTLTKQALMGLTQQRIQGQTTPNMPQYLKDMDPKAAAKYYSDISKPGVQIDFGSGKLTTRAARDRLTVGIQDIQITRGLVDQLTKLIIADPSVAGLSGTAGRFGQKVAGAVKSLQNITPAAQKFDKAVVGEIGKDLAVADGPTKLAVGKLLADPNVSKAQVLEAALALRYARSLDVNSRVTKSQYDDATNVVRITGFTGADQVIKKLQTIDQNVLAPMESGYKNLLDTNPQADDGSGANTAPPDDGDEGYRNFLKENGLPGGDSDEEDK